MDQTVFRVNSGTFSRKILLFFFGLNFLLTTVCVLNAHESIPVYVCMPCEITLYTAAVTIAVPSVLYSPKMTFRSSSFMYSAYDIEKPAKTKMFGGCSIDTLQGF